MHRNKNNQYTKWGYHYFKDDDIDTRGGISVDLYGPEPKELKDRRIIKPYEDPIDDEEGEFIPILSTKMSWKINRQALIYYAENCEGPIWSFLSYEGHWDLLRRCFGKHLRHVMREFKTRYGLDEEDIAVIHHNPTGKNQLDHDKLKVLLYAKLKTAGYNIPANNITCATENMVVIRLNDKQILHVIEDSPSITYPGDCMYDRDFLSSADAMPKHVPEEYTRLVLLTKSSITEFKSFCYKR